MTAIKLFLLCDLAVNRTVSGRWLLDIRRVLEPLRLFYWCNA